MSKKMQLPGAAILALEDQVSPYLAIAEGIDNGVDQQATRLMLSITSRSMTLVDNGVGCADLNLIGSPFLSASRKDENKIGVKGIGANQFMATFGRKWRIESVTRDKRPAYRRYDVAWDPEGPGPDQYEGQPRSVFEAPAEIRGGGTKITVTQRNPGVDYNLDTICDRLEKTYRPALRNGVIIGIIDPETGFKRQLKDITPKASDFVEPLQTLKGVAAGRTFSVTYGRLKEPGGPSGCNVWFGPRVMDTWGNIGKYALPSRTFVDVALSAEWKNLFTTNKQGVRESRALNAALAILLDTWLAKQQQEAASIRLKLLLGDATNTINNTIAFLNKLVEGEYGPKPRKKAEPGPEPKPRPILPPNRPIVPRRTRAEYGTGKWGIENDAPGVMEVKFQPDTGLGKALYRLSITNGTLVVWINTGPEQAMFSKLLTSDKKKFADQTRAELVQLGFFAYAQTAATDPRNPKVAPLFAALNKLGYKIDLDDPIDISAKVLNFFFNDIAQPKPKFVVIEGGKAEAA